LNISSARLGRDSIADDPIGLYNMTTISFKWLRYHLKKVEFKFNTMLENQLEMLGLLPLI